MGQIQLIQITVDELQDLIAESIDSRFEEFEKHFQKIDSSEYIERAQVAEMLNINLSTLHNWTKQGKLISYGIGRRVYYKKHEIEKAIIRLNN